LAEEALDLPRIDARLADTFSNHRSSQESRGLREPRVPMAGEPAGDAALLGSAVPDPSLVVATASDDGHTLTTRPTDGLDWDSLQQRAAYVLALLDRARAVATGRDAIVQIFDARGRDVKRFLADASYVADPEVSGIAHAPFALGPLAGTRLRLGSDRVP